MFRRQIAVLLSLASSCSLITTAQAAPVPEPGISPEPSAPAAPVERIEVTGSHIKRIDTEGVAAVQTVSRQEIDKSGYDSVSDVLRDTGAASFGSARETSGSNAAGNAEVDLRGLGADNTLVLLNGQRLPTDAITGTVDLNLIPLAAVERIEILKDGASAVYGSDALGGVVNIITRKDFKGTQINATQTLPDRSGGAQTNVGLVNGINTEKLNVVTVVTYRNNRQVWSRDRDWSKNGVSKIGDPGSYRNKGGKWRADPLCPADKLVTTGSGTFCSFRYSDYASEIPGIEQVSGMSEAHLDVNPDLKVYGRAFATHRKVNWSFAPAPGTFTIPGAVADKLGANGQPLPGATAGKDLDVQYRLLDLGTRDTENTVNAYSLLVGSTVRLSSDWSLDASINNSVVRGLDKGVNGYALTQKLNDAIESGAYNPFGTPGNKGSLADVKYTPSEETFSQLVGADVKASGDVAELGDWGSLGVAVGGSYSYQRYVDSFDLHSVNDEVFGNAGSSGKGQRNVEALYSEVSVPVGKKALEVQLAGRYDHYSDFGSTFNPKLGLLYHVNDAVLLRGSVGTGFRAPLMQELYAASALGFPSFIDHVACNKGDKTSCTAQQYQVTNQGNPGLKQETSIAYNAGVVVEPTRDFNVSFDWFLTKISNVPGIDLDDMTQAEANGVNPANYGVTVNRDANGFIDSIVAPLQNLSERKISGFDLAGGYRFWKFKLSDSYSRLFYFKEEGFPGAGMKDKLGWAGNPSWRNVAALTYNPGARHDISLSRLTTAGQETLDHSGRIDQFSTWDLTYQYRSESLGTFTAGVKNIIGSGPPEDPSNSTRPVNYALYDPNGRQFIVGYQKGF